MSGMATEIAARMAADGVTDPTQLGGAPGNEGGTAPPAAEPSTTETGAPGTTPDTIPYARFKEVNDRYSSLKGYERLAEFGYAPDSLERLAGFDAAYQADPIGTLASMASNLDLPQELKDAIQAHASGTSTTPPAEGAPSGDGIAKAAELSPQDKARLEYVDKVIARDEQSASQAQLDRVLSAWDSMDKKDEIETPMAIKLAHISAMSGSGANFATIEEFATAARKPVVDFRGDVLGGAVIRTGLGGLPPALPGGLPAAAPAVSFGGSFKAASKAAAEAIARGEIPGTGV